MTQPNVPMEPEPGTTVPQPTEPQTPNSPQPEFPERKEYPIHREIPEQPIHEGR